MILWFTQIPEDRNSVVAQPSVFGLSNRTSNRVFAENAVGLSDPSVPSEMVSISTDQEATEPHFLRELRDVVAVAGQRVRRMLASVHFSFVWLRDLIESSWAGLRKWVFIIISYFDFCSSLAYLVIRRRRFDSPCRCRRSSFPWTSSAHRPRTWPGTRTASRCTTRSGSSSWRTATGTCWFYGRRDSRTRATSGSEPRTEWAWRLPRPPSQSKVR